MPDKQYQSLCLNAEGTNNHAHKLGTSMPCKNDDNQTSLLRGPVTERPDDSNEETTAWPPMYCLEYCRTQLTWHHQQLVGASEMGRGFCDDSNTRSIECQMGE